MVISDTGMPSLQHPALTYALRGIIAFEITLHGPARDLHSGIFGGAVDNPAMALAQLLAKVRDGNGRIQIPGFYEDVEPMPIRAPGEPAFSDQGCADEKTAGRAGTFWRTRLHPDGAAQRRPTFEINGLTSGYQGEGSKTIVPAWARAKITCRLVPASSRRKSAKSCATG